jgi:hypothetical protein
MKPDKTLDQRAVESAQTPRGSGSSSDPQEQFRVVITKEANDGLQAATDRIGAHCAVSRSDVANYVFLNLARMLVDADIKALRALHFDEKRMLGALAKSENELPEEIRRAIREHYGVVEKDKRRAPRTASATPNDTVTEIV